MTLKPSHLCVSFSWQAFVWHEPAEEGAQCLGDRHARRVRLPPSPVPEGFHLHWHRGENTGELLSLSLRQNQFWPQINPQKGNAEICLNVLLVDKKGGTCEERHPPIFQTFALSLHWGITDFSTTANQTLEVHFYYSIKINNLIIAGMVGRHRCSQSPGVPV